MVNPVSIGWDRRIRETASLFWLFLRPGKVRPELVYDLLSTHNLGGKNSLFINVGYWKEANEYDEACRAMADLLAQEVKLSQSDTVLDVGFGFGDQDLHWMERFSPRKIHGLNVTASQVAIARQRVAEKGFADRIDLQVGSATAVPHPDASFDKVLALEAAGHFDTRDDFFREAFRVLRPGGVLGLTDTVPAPGHQAITFPVRMYLSFWQVPRANWYGTEELVKRIQQAGFVDIQARSIREHSFVALQKAMATRMKDADILARVHPMIRLMMANDAGLDWMDYVVVSARKPAVRA